MKPPSARTWGPWAGGCRGFGHPAALPGMLLVFLLESWGLFLVPVVIEPSTTPSRTGKAQISSGEPSLIKPVLQLFWGFEMYGWEQRSLLQVVSAEQNFHRRLAEYEMSPGCARVVGCSRARLLRCRGVYAGVSLVCSMSHMTGPNMLSSMLIGLTSQLSTKAGWVASRNDEARQPFPPPTLHTLAAAAS